MILYKYLIILASLLLLNLDAPGNDKYIIVLDMHEFYTKTHFADSSILSQINSMNYLIENSDPDKVIYVISLSRVLYVSLKGIKVDTVSTPDIDKRVKQVNNNVFAKTKHDAFSSEDLAGFLKKHEARKFIVVGLAAERCVYKTILGGKKLGYEMYTVPEAIIGMTPEGKEKAIKKLAKKGITLLSLDKIKNTP